MQARRRSFIWASHHEYGEGWLATDNRDFDTVLGFGVSHDVLEHMDNLRGPEAEFRAFGAMVYGRGLNSWFNGDMGEALALDVETFLSSGMSCPGRSNARSLGEGSFEDRQCENLIDEVCESIKKMLEHYRDTGFTNLTPSEYGAFIDNARGHMRNGVRRAEKRYGRSHALFTAFKSLTDDKAVQGICHDHPSRDEFMDGDKLCIYVNPAKGVERISVNYVDLRNGYAY